MTCSRRVLDLDAAASLDNPDNCPASVANSSGSESTLRFNASSL